MPSLKPYRPYICTVMPAVDRDSIMEAVLQAKSERFEMRLDQGILDAVDNWREEQADRPSRAEAVRRLVEAGLTVTGRRRVTITDGEKLIVAMLAELLEHQEITADIDPKIVKSILYGGHYW